MKNENSQRQIAAKVKALLAIHPEWGRDNIARELGIKPNGALRRIVELIKAGKPITREYQAAHKPGAGTDRPSESAEYKENSAELSTCRKNVRTLEELLAYMRVDLTVWEVERHVINKWEVGGKPSKNNRLVANTASGFAVEPLYQVKAWLRRKLPTIRETSFEQLLKRIEKKAPQPRKQTYYLTPTGSKRPKYLLEIALFDAHFGLLAWGNETGEDYDLKIAETRYQAAVDDLLTKTRGCQPERIVFPIGNDFFHINNPQNVTPASHNPLDVDGRLVKVLVSGELAVIRALEACAQVAAVDVLWIPGNHDPETSFYLCRVVQAYFRNNPRINVNADPAPRKYVHYGQNLIGYTHGNEEAHRDLPTIMAGEKGEAWSRSKFREWHVGHRHKQAETRYSAGDTYGGVIVSPLPSLAGTDAWHYKKGYVNNRRIAEARLYDFEHGPVATYQSRSG